MSITRMIADFIVGWCIGYFFASGIIEKDKYRILLGIALTIAFILYLFEFANV